jgi:hypothetical protein
MVNPPLSPLSALCNNNSDGYIPILIMFGKLPIGGRWNPNVQKDSESPSYDF